MSLSRRSIGVICLLGLALLLCGVQPALAAKSLLNPAGLTQEAPATYRVKFETSRGDFVVSVKRDWAPLGADRFYNLVKYGFYDGVRFFRAVPGFVVQFGISGDPAVSKAWKETMIDDDPVKQRNNRGTITFATSGKNSRTTQVFINYTNNRRLDSMGFAPFGRVVEGMEEAVDRLYQGYGEKVTNQQFRIVKEGNAFLDERFPQLDFIERAWIVAD